MSNYPNSLKMSHQPLLNMSPTERLFTRPGFLLRRLHQVSVGMFEDACKTLALTPTQYGTMVIINAKAAQDQSSVARQLGIDKVTVMRVLKGLESRGLLTRSVNEQDRRQYFLTLTEDGASVLGQAHRLAESVQDKLLSVLPEGEGEVLLRVLHDWADALEPFARVPMDHYQR